MRLAVGSMPLVCSYARPRVSGNRKVIVTTLQHCGETSRRNGRVHGPQARDPINEQEGPMAGST